MPKPTGPTNPLLAKLIADIRGSGHKEKEDFLLTLAKLLEKPERRRAEVNLSRIERYAKEGETLVVPGRVLADGTIAKPVKVAAAFISASAKAKVLAAGGKVMSIPELIEQNPKGTGVRIMV